MNFIPIKSIQFPYSPWNSPGQNAGVGSLSLLQGIFPAQGLNPDLPHCRQILTSWATREAQEYDIVFHFIIWGILLIPWLILWMKMYWKINPCHSKAVFHCLHLWAIRHNALPNTCFLYLAWKSFLATSPTIFLTLQKKKNYGCARSSLLLRLSLSGYSE